MRRFVPAAALASLILPASVQAHARLVSSSPAANAAVAPPATIGLRFSERLVAKLSTATLAMAPTAGKDLPVPATATSGADGTLLQLRPARPLAPGKYRVTYRVTSADTHRIVGSLLFSVK